MERKLNYNANNENRLTSAGIFPRGLIFVLLIILSLPSFISHTFSNARAETSADEGDKPLTAINYLDFEFVSPTSVYADDEIIVVADGERTVFFYDEKIYIRKIKVAGSIARNGDYIYYSKDNNLGRVKISEFVHEIVTDSSSSPVGANEFAFFADKLITLTNTGMNYYVNFVKQPAPYEFDAPASTYLPLAKICYASGDEYYFINGNLYKKNERLRVAVADFVSEINGKPYFSNADGIFCFENNETKPILEVKTAFKNRQDGSDVKIYGLTEHKGEIIFVNATDKKLMICGFSGENLRDYIFDVEIPTGYEAKFSSSPETVMVTSGRTIHSGFLKNGIFDYEKTSRLSEDEAFVLLGETEGYYVLFGRTGFYLTASSNASAINQNPSIMREKGYVLHDSSTYVLPVADKNHTSFPLTKGEEIFVLAKYEMNGIEYYLIENENGEQAFVAGGEITAELLPEIKQNEEKTENLSSADYTLYAIIIILLGAAVFTLAMFMIFSKKNFIKL